MTALLLFQLIRPSSRVTQHLKRLRLKGQWNTSKKAGKLAESAEDKFDHLVATMRVYSAIKPTTEWLKTAEDAYSDIRDLKVDEKN